MSPAAEPGAQTEGVLLPPPPPAGSGPSRTLPGAPPSARAGPLPSPRLPEPLGRPGGLDARTAGDAGRAGPGPARTRTAAWAPRSPVPRSLRRGRRQRRARCCRLRPPLPLRSPLPRRSAPLACPALLAFFPLPGGRGERSRGRGGAGRRRRRPRTARRRRREASRSPTGCALPNLSLPETGSLIGSRGPHYGLHQGFQSFQITR